MPSDVRKVGLALGLSAVLSACVGGGGGDARDLASTDSIDRLTAVNGPEADYPQILGEPFSVDGQLFTPADTLSYDAVGYAAADSDGGTKISVAHKTLPVPSYVEITSLDSGKTVLARVERRGPMTASRLVSLSPGAQAQLGVRDGTPVRVRRVNPPEFERAELRAGRAGPQRLETPSSLLAVLKKKLPAMGSASLADPKASQIARTAALPSTRVAPSTAARAPELPAVAARTPASVEKSFDRTFPAARKVNGAYPLPPMNTGARAAAPVPPVSRPKPPVSKPPVVVARAPEATSYSMPGVRTAAARPAAPVARPEPAVARAPARPAPVRATADGRFVVQAAALSNKARAENLASKIDGFVTSSGRYYRVRTGPYATRGQAEAALAKVRAAGYSDARVFSAG
ncbi:hypothetical protein GCM10022213_05100 [Parerythrobacter jejuensis]